MSSSRRDFIRTSGLISLGFLGLYNYSYPSEKKSHPNGAGFGPLVPDSKGIMSLPKGFSYSIISSRGTPMIDGLLVPGAPDGMATFNGGPNRTIIIRNHENSADDELNSPFGKKNDLLSKVDRNKVYDFGRGRLPATGGTTTLVYNHKLKTIEHEYLSLAGTLRNCAGGPTPWNTWITCEETLQKADENFEKDHGYTFEVIPSVSPSLSDPIPISGMGRFNHEAVAVDPRTGIVYLTEDDQESLIYRYIPNTAGKLLDGGKLQALVFVDQASLDTRNWRDLTTPKLPSGKWFDVKWIDLDNVDAPENDLRFRGHKAGAARFARGEGMWFGNNEFYFACTSGGLTKGGQIFRYQPGAYEGTNREMEAPGKIQIFAEPNDKDILNHCDNLTIAPWGDVILCEDNARPFLIGITPAGEYYRLAENTGYRSELSGVVFSPDGSTLFVNIQGQGLTLAIEGPWKK
jgi:secreted PhoX family phosphatase